MVVHDSYGHSAQCIEEAKRNDVISMKLVLTGGCTGGHIYPALAVGDKFRSEDPSNEVIYIAKGEDLERKIIPSHGYELIEVDSTWLDRSNPARALKTIRRTLNGRRDARRVMKRFKPDAVFSTGSFVSVPVVLAAKSLGIPVYLHEQNGFPGVSNRMAARFARRVFLGFRTAGEYFSQKEKIIYSGNPVREEFSGRDKKADRDSLGIPADDLVIMVFGGSLGSETTNSVGEAIAREYAGREGITVIWGTGIEYYDSIRARLDKEGFCPSNVRISAYIANMPELLSASDLCVSRSGALSTAEMTMAGRAAIFIPSPNVTADHQYYNAKAVADAGGAVIVREEETAEATAETVLGIVRSLEADRSEIDRMADASRSIAPAEAADIIYKTIMETC